jgi:predicted RNase H-like nuclease (RuvC/YqgF family)
MKTKVCSKCNIEKNIENFGKSNKSSDGLMYCCRECNNLRSKQYRKENHQKTLETQRNWRRKNPDWVKNVNSINSKKNIKKNLERLKEWYKKNPDKKREYRENYKPKKRLQKKLRMQNDAIFNLTNRLRSRLYKYLKTMNITKKNRTFDIIGCTPDFLKKHLEEKFVIGMSWENRNEWHIDHIIPLSSAKTEKELYELCYYTNLQPLWVQDNLKKSNKRITIKIKGE